MLGRPYRPLNGERVAHGRLQNFFAARACLELSVEFRVRRIERILFQAYLEDVGMASTESIATVANAAVAEIVSPPSPIDPAHLAEVWRTSGAASWGLAQADCDRILLEVGTAANFGLADGETPTRERQAAYFQRLCLEDVVLARACAQGQECAWEHFVALYRQPLIRTATAITGSESLGRELADQLYAELYGLTTRNGERRCPLASYLGRGSLMGWLRTTLAQRHVDNHRRTRREEPLEVLDAPAPEPSTQTPPAKLSQLERAIEVTLGQRNEEERFLLAAYYLDRQTLLQIARILGVHEATVSRKLHRATKEIRKQVLRNLQHAGLSKRAAEEAMGADPRDLHVNVKKLLQNLQNPSFPMQAVP
jgi:RNA polymerase sigma-70 factor (ECF subfamily)